DRHLHFAEHALYRSRRWRLYQHRSGSKLEPPRHGASQRSGPSSDVQWRPAHSGRRHSRAWGMGNPDRGADTYANGYGYSDVHAYTNTDSYSHAHTYSYSHGYSNVHAYANADSYVHAHTHSYSYSNVHAYANADSYVHAYTHSYSYSHGYS